MRLEGYGRAAQTGICWGLICQKVVDRTNERRAPKVKWGEAPVRPGMGSGLQIEAKAKSQQILREVAKPNRAGVEIEMGNGLSNVDWIDAI